MKIIIHPFSLPTSSRTQCYGGLLNLVMRVQLQIDKQGNMFNLKFIINLTFMNFDKNPQRQQKGWESNPHSVPAVYFFLII